MKSGIKLGTTIHDPEGRILYQFEKYASEIKKLYSDFLISITKSSDKRISDEAKKMGISVIYPETDDVGKIYFEALFNLSEGLMHYCDLDRILHWREFYPAELEEAIKFIEKSPYDYIIFERTQRAHKSHHEALYKTEHEANVIVSTALGMNKYHDFFSGSFAMNGRARQILETLGVQNGWEFFTRYPKTISDSGMSIGFFQAEGLEWETPDRYREEIAKIGIENWRVNFSTQEEWARRIKIQQDFLNGLK